MNRKCKHCHQEKELEKFVRKGDKYRYKCKECENSQRRTGKPNLGRFQKGHTLGKRYEKGNISWSSLNKGLYKGKRVSESRHSAKYKEWSRLVKERDGKKCVKCFSEKRISSHHIKPWKDFIELRFDIDNGITLCSVCHGKEEGFKKGSCFKPSLEVRKKLSEKAKLRILTPEHKEKLRLSRLGKIGPNKGKKFTDQHRKKLSEAAKLRCQRQQMI